MKDILRILIGPLLWLASFSAVYGLHGIVCGFGIDGLAAGSVSLPRILLAGAWLAAILLQAIVLAGLYSRRYGSPSGFVRSISRATGWVGLVAAVWTLFPTVATSFCV